MFGWENRKAELKSDKSMQNSIFSIVAAVGQKAGISNSSHIFFIVCGQK
jgi:hypothetical protein